MKKRLILVLLFFGCLVTACDKENEMPQTECTTVQLINNDTGPRFDKVMVLYEDADYLIKAPVNLFVSDLYSYINNYETYLSTVNNIVNDAKTLDILTVNTYFPDDRITSVLAHLLENGHCYVYSKKESVPLEELCFEKFSCPAPVAGAFGRRFYLKNKLFFEIADGNC